MQSQRGKVVSLRRQVVYVPIIPVIIIVNNNDMKMIILK